MRYVTPIFLAAFLSMPTPSPAQDDVLSALHTQMNYLNERQSVISQNLANADTPGYKAKDLAPINPLRAGSTASRLAMVTTSPMHMGGKTKPIEFKSVREDDAYDTSPDGNNVDIEQQMVKMSQTDLEYQKTVGITRQFNGLLRTAIGDGR